MKRLGKFFSMGFKDESGAVLIMVALSMVVLLGMTALVIDVGYLYQERRQMVTAADAAALAGAQELIYNNDNHEEVKKVAREYAAMHGADPERIEVEIPNSYTVEVETVKNVGFTFARVLGFTDLDVPARAVAVVLPLELGKGVVPWAIPEQEFIIGDLVTLKYARHSDGDIGAGNFHALALGGSGANTYRDNIKYGTDEVIKIGHWYDTQTGNMSGPTMQGVEYRISLCTCTDCFSGDVPNYDCPRFITVPIYSEILGPGNTKVLIVAFAVFYLEGIDGHGVNSVVTGKYVEAVKAGEVGGPYDPSIDYGAYNVRLIE